MDDLERLHKLKKFQKDLSKSDRHYSNLTTRELEWLKLRLGLEDGRPLTVEEIADHWGMTVNEVRQIEQDAISKLKKPDPPPDRPASAAHRRA